MRFLRAAATVGGFTMISRVAGFLRDLLMASVVGASAMADAFFVALKLPNLFRRISAEGAFNVAFVPLFSEALEQGGRDRALAMARTIMGVMLAVLSVFTAVMMVAMPAVISVLAPGFVDEPQRYEAAITLSRITFPYLLFISLASLIGGVMNVFYRFAPYAFLPLLFNLCLIAALLFHGLVGMQPVQALAWGVVVSGVFQLLWMIVSAAISGALVVPTWPKITPEVKRLWVLMLPAILGAGVMHINIVADMIMASFLGEGSVSHLYYADRLNQLPLGVIGVAIGTALLPLLSKAVAAADSGQVQKLYSQAIQYAFMIAMPAALALLAAGPFFVRALFQHGAFTQQDATIAAYVLQAYAIGLPAYVIGKVLQTACFARQDTRSPVRISVIITVINILLSLIFIQFIGVIGIALSTGLVGWLQVVLLRRVLVRRGDVLMDPALPPLLLKMGGCALIMAVCVFGVSFMLSPYSIGGFVERLIACLGLVISGALVYGLCLKFIAKVNLKNLVKDLKV